MKSILTSVAAGILFTAFAIAQPGPTRMDRMRGLYPTTRPADHTPASAGQSLLVYVITGGSQFGVVDLGSGTPFVPIGPDLPADVGMGLVPGPRTSLLTLAFSGNLVAIDPAARTTSVIGPTGLHDCSMPDSPYDSQCANVIGRLDAAFYATDFANNIYSVDPDTGKATLIGPTGIPPLPFVPLSQTGGSINVYNESLFSIGGKLYANFAAFARNPGAPPTIVDSAELYQIDPRTGRATWIAPTALGLTCIVNVNDTIYAFNVATHEVVTLDLATGQTSAVSDLDIAAGLIAGAAPARPVPNPGHPADQKPLP